MRRKKRGHSKELGFKYHGVLLEHDSKRYQVVHETATITYAVEICKKGKPGGPVERFPKE